MVWKGNPHDSGLISCRVTQNYLEQPSALGCGDVREKAGGVKVKEMSKLTCYPQDVVGQVKGFGAVKISQEHVLSAPRGSRAGGRGRDS